MSRGEAVRLAALCLLALVVIGGLAFVASWPPNEPCAEYADSARYQSYESCIQGASAQSVAVSTEVLAWFTVVLALGTCALWYVTWQALVHARQDSERQAVTAKEQAKITRTAIWAVERPWITIDNLAVSSVEVINFDLVDPVGFINAKVSFTISMYGRLPAQRVRFAGAVLVSGGGIGIDAFLKDIADNDQSGELLFPQETPLRQIDIEASSGEIGKLFADKHEFIKRDYAAKYGSDFDVLAPEARRNVLMTEYENFPNPSLVVCASYRFAHSNDEVHQTVIHRHLGYRVEGHAEPFFLTPDHGTYAPGVVWGPTGFIDRAT